MEDTGLVSVHAGSKALPVWRSHVVLCVRPVAGLKLVLWVCICLSCTCVQASAPSPLRVLCASWNVGNSLPPPPEQLQQWLKGAKE